MLRRTNTPQSSLMNSLRGSTGAGERLLPPTQKRLSLESVAAICDLNLDDSSNRRTLGLLPMPASRQGHEIADTDSLKLQNLLLSIESRGISCCIRVFSNNNKSRSALIIYRGRLIACVFGAKTLASQLSGKEAFDRIMQELLSPKNVVDCHLLSDEMVLAGASLFHGGLNSVSNGLEPLQAYQNCAFMMINKKMTGSIVCKGSDESNVCSTYFADGRIIGVYSFAEGWLTPTQTAALKTIQPHPNAEIWMSILPVPTEAAESLTESLTGLDFAPPAKTEKPEA